MISLNCFSSNSDQPMAVVHNGSGQHSHHNRFSGWSLCGTIPSKMFGGLFGCCSRHKRKRRPSFNRNRRVSFPDLNTSTVIINNVPEPSSSHEPRTEQPIALSPINKEMTKSVPEEVDHNVSIQKDNNNDNQRQQNANILNRLSLFGFFKHHISRPYNDTDLVSAQCNHKHSPMMQLSISALTANNSNCDLIQQPTTTNKFELLESKNKNLNVENENIMHNHCSHQQQHSMVPLPSGSGLHHQPIDGSSSSKFSLTKTTFRSKKSVVPSQTIRLEQQQLRMDVSTKRLMKEIGDLMRRKQNQQLTANFSIELINDSLYEWYIKIYEFDKESQIYLDMQQYQIPYVQLHAIFPESYPFDPPFIRVVTPYIERGYVMEGGAICLELLTKTGWTSAYTMESVIIQLMASFVKGQATIKATKDVSKCFTKKSAVNSFRHIVRIHDKHGWVDTPLYEG